MFGLQVSTGENRIFPNELIPRVLTAPIDKPTDAATHPIVDYQDLPIGKFQRLPYP